LHYATLLATNDAMIKLDRKRASASLEFIVDSKYREQALTERGWQN
jgi:hypothetical protein